MTGDEDDSSSKSPMFVQLHGTKGPSRFYQFGKDFKKAKQGEAKIQVGENIGVLRSITLRAGGSDGWNSASSISISTPTKMTYEFKTNVVLGKKLQV